MPDAEKSNPPNAPSLPSGDGQAKGTGYGAGGSGSGADRAAPAERSSWDAPGVTPGGERTSRAVPDKPEDRD